MSNNISPTRVFLKSIILSLMVYFGGIKPSIGQNLTISNSGETGTFGTNWSITSNILNVAASGSANIHPNVISNHLNNVGNLTIILPWQSGQIRNCSIDGSISYTGSATRTLTFKIANSIFMNSTNYSISATGSGALNVILRSGIGLGIAYPDHGSISIRQNSTINTNGGHLWIGGGATDETWNGLTVGNFHATTWDLDMSGVWIENSTLNTNGGNLSIKGLSHYSATTLGTLNRGIKIAGTTISTGGGNINIQGDIYGNFNNGMATEIVESSTNSSNISTTTGEIWITGYGSTNSNNVGWRLGVLLSGTATFPSVVSTISGNINLEG